MVKLKRQTVEFKPDCDSKIMVMNGKKFRMINQKVGKDKHIKKIIFQEFTDTDEDRHQKRIEKLSNYIAGETRLTIQDVLKNILNSCDRKTIDKLEDKMRRKVRPKVTRGCLEINMGNAHIPLVE